MRDRLLVCLALPLLFAGARSRVDQLATQLESAEAPARTAAFDELMRLGGDAAFAVALVHAQAHARDPRLGLEGRDQLRQLVTRALPFLLAAHESAMPSPELLGAVNSPAAEPLLAHALRAPSEAVVESAAVALGRARCPHALALLAPLAADARPSRRYAAVLGLKLLGDAAAQSSLQKVLALPDAPARLTGDEREAASRTLHAEAQAALEQLRRKPLPAPPLLQEWEP